ncbi:cell division control protein 21 [Halorhabdus tiamatea SARL4B]|uniref:DNA helicase n=1 Tax=Halorhabdus tiamatea SARL4B TaxID=1033806 RepID=F7PMN2_9EURY|nr:minichromosome maintenance protein MCM [Halorhabdus tiamatea]ERJ07432.1 cell division control protein 21 [Halorhabdus tiamatea SARL4B]
MVPRNQNTEFIDLFDEFYRDYYRNEIGELAQNYPDEQKSLIIDWENLYQFDPDLAEDYRNKPDQLQEYAEEALRLFELPVDVRLGQAHVRIENLPETTAVGEIRADHRGQLISIPGTVRSVSPVVSYTTDAAFECQRCGTLTRMPQTITTGDFSVSEPVQCHGCEREGPYRVNLDQSEMEDRQLVRLEAASTDNARESPDSIVLVTANDTVGDVQPGDTVLANGVLKVVSPSEDSHFDATISDKYVSLLSYEHVEPENLISLSRDDEDTIVDLSEADDIYDRFIESVAPHAPISDEIKLGVVLQLFGGVEKSLEDGTILPGTINTGIVTDPGTFVDDVVRYAARLNPKSIRVDGTNTSQVGLTTAAYRSSNDSKNWALDAGALVLADGGLAAITRIDELKSGARAGLESAMREQEVLASKGTATRALPADASVLASARPKYGRFDQYESVGEQLNLEPHLISQFDLLFIQTDQPDADGDAEVASNILDASVAGEVLTQARQADDSPYTDEEVEEITSEVEPKIDPDLFRKYVAYAKRSCFPTLTEDAKVALRDFFVELRSQGLEEDAPVPVPLRKLESLVKLAEASARVRLSDTVEEEDADRVIGLLRSSMEDIGIDPETGELDDEVTRRGLSEEARERLEDIRGIVHEIEKEYDEGAPVDVVVEEAEKIGMKPSKVEHEIEKLKQQGEVYEPRTDHLRTT